MDERLVKWVFEKDVEHLSAFAIPLVYETYPYIGEKVMDKFVRNELSPESILKLMHNGHRYAMIQNDGEEAGFFSYNTEGDTLHLDKLYLVGTCREKGLGTKVMEYLFNVAKTEGYMNVDVIVVDLNVPAIKFYKKLGFERICPEKGYTVRRSIMRRTFRSAELLDVYYI